MLGSKRLCLTAVFALILTQTCLGGKNRRNKEAKEGRKSKHMSERGQISQTPHQNNDDYRGSSPEDKRLVDLTELLDDRIQATGSALSENALQTNAAEQRHTEMLAKIRRGDTLSWFGEKIGSPVFFSLTPKSDLLFRVAVGITDATIDRADILLARDEFFQLSGELANILMKIPDSWCKEAIKSALSPHLRALFAIDEIFYIIAPVDKFMFEYRKELAFLGVKTNREGGQLSSETADRPRITDLMLALEKSSDKPVSDDLIKGAIGEYKKLKKSIKDVLEEDPRFRLVVDFAILPAIKFNIALDADRLIKAYTEFRPGYVDKRPIGEGKLPENSAGFLKLMKQGLEKASGEPSTGDFVKAKSEYDDAANKLSHYRKESNIYDNLDELARVINLLNHQHTEIFLLQVYPKINHKMKPLEAIDIFREFLSGERSLMLNPELMNMGRLFLELEEAYSLRSDASGITPEMLEAVEHEFEEYPKNRVGNFDHVLLCLVEDLIFSPMKYNSKHGIVVGHKEFVDRLVQRYKRSRLAYFDRKEFGDGTFPSNIEGLLHLFRMGTGEIREKPTEEVFINAQDEIIGIHNLVRSKLSNGEWNIDEKQGEFDQYNNLGSYPPFTVFCEYISSKLDIKFDPAKLLSTYRELLRKIDFSSTVPVGRSNLSRDV